LSTCAKAGPFRGEEHDQAGNRAGREPVFRIRRAGGAERARYDRVFRIDADIAELKARIPEVREIVYLDAGHLIPVEQPERFTRDLVAFAESL
jgi:pimeloyl-ACP methyl ester carboxylesterase